jgi:cytidylate kinase
MTNRLLRGKKNQATVISIDGPVAAGKSVVGRLVAERLGYKFLDTGTMYRAITWIAIKRGLALEDERDLEDLAKSTLLELAGVHGERVLANGIDVTSYLRVTEVERAVSIVSRCASLRRELVKRQQALASEGHIVIVGRDIGTVVVPNAGVKVFLNASVQERARRRSVEMDRTGKALAMEKVQVDLERRDMLDTQRITSPLRPADDAHILDTDGLEVEQVVARIMEWTHG